MLIQTREINLDDKEEIERIRRAYGHDTASHAFASIYIWQKDMRLSLYMGENMFAVKIGVRGENDWFFPCGDEDEIKIFLEQFENQKACFWYMRLEDVELLEKLCPGLYSVEETLGDDEYLYCVKEQKELCGRRLRTVRNHINRVKKDHVLKYDIISESNMQDVRIINEIWCKKSNDSSWLEDIYASKCLLDTWEILDAFGVLIWVDDEPFAIVAGYPLNEECFDMFLAKQKDTLSGLSSYAKYALYCSLPEKYTFVNAEEDLDIPGLRTVKQQMGPCGKIKMFRARHCKAVIEEMPNDY